MIQLRPYQEKIIHDVRQKFMYGNKRVIMCAPTGSGKTVMFTSIALNTLKKGNKVLILTDRIELLKQTFKSLENAGIEPDFYNAHTKKTPTSPAIVAMIETVKRRHKANKLTIPVPDLIIVDECHRGNFNAIFDIFPDAFYIGATATPLATAKDKPLKNYFEDIVSDFDVPDLIEQEFLCPAVSYTAKVVDNSQLKVDYKKGDFSDKSLSQAFDKPTVYTGLIKAMRQFAENKKTIIFCVNIKHSENTEYELRAAGYKTAIVTSNSTPEERQENLDFFHSTPDAVMVNCGILTTGYDHPPIECVVMNRATISVPLWLQCCGRGSRLAPGKEEFTIIDMGGNINRLGSWENRRDWKKWFFDPPKKGQEQPPPTKECPECEAIIHARIMQCPHCEHMFEAKEIEQVEAIVVPLQQIPKHLKNRYIADFSIDELLQVKKIRKYKTSYIVRIVRNRGIEAMTELRVKLGYKKGWEYYQLHGDKTFTNIKIK